MTTLELIDHDSAPLFLRIVESVVRDIGRGRLRPGALLPGSRALAHRLEVHRNTVLRAYRELEAQGWIVSHAARGTYVAETLPSRPLSPHPLAVNRKGRSSSEPRPENAKAAYRLRGPAPRRAATPLELPARWRSLGMLPLLGGLPDLRLAPRKALARAYRRALLHSPGILGYGSSRGHRQLRERLAAHLREERGLNIDADQLLMTRGSQQGLFVVASRLLREGDEVLVESLGYTPAWAALTAAGARLTPVPLDENGLRIDAIEAIVAERPVRAIYLTPHHQYPTTVTLSAPRRMALLQLAARHQIALIEDDYDHEFHYSGRPVFPLAARDPHRSVIHVGTFSKVLAPGLRLGWVSAPAEVITELAKVRRMIDRQGNAALECAIAELLEDGEVMRHILRMRRIYRRRRDALAEMLDQRFGDSLDWRDPHGGLALWVHGQGTDTNAWAEAAKEHGVVFQSTAHFALRRRRHRHMRIGFAALDEEGLDRALRILERTRPR